MTQKIATLTISYGDGTSTIVTIPLTVEQYELLTKQITTVGASLALVLGEAIQ